MSSAYFIGKEEHGDYRHLIDDFKWIYMDFKWTILEYKFVKKVTIRFLKAASERQLVSTELFYLM